MVGPVINPGWPGILVPTALHLAALVPHAPVAVTQRLAPGYGFGKFTVMALVLVPEAKVAPAGTTQLYPVAPGTAGTLKATPVAPGHTFETPVIG